MDFLTLYCGVNLVSSFSGTSVPMTPRSIPWFSWKHSIQVFSFLLLFILVFHGLAFFEFRFSLCQTGRLDLLTGQDWTPVMGWQRSSGFWQVARQLQVGDGTSSLSPVVRQWKMMAQNALPSALWAGLIGASSLSLSLSLSLSHTHTHTHTEETTHRCVSPVENRLGDGSHQLQTLLWKEQKSQTVSIVTRAMWTNTSGRLWRFISSLFLPHHEMLFNLRKNNSKMMWINLMF